MWNFNSQNLEEIETVQNTNVLEIKTSILILLFFFFFFFFE